MDMKQREFWFVVGSQFLYGPEVLETVAARAAEMVEKMNASGNLPCKLVYKVTAKTNKEIADVVKEANYNDDCLGIISWCHTFSPSKMWINGFVNLQKPYCHLATQYNREIPNEEIDMDFMNLNQAAHGDREHGFIAARLRMPRKVIAGYWQDEDVQKRLGAWMRAAIGVAVSKDLKVMRFGDNMREAEGHALWRQHAGSGRHRGRQGGGPGQAGLAGEHLACGPAGGDHERRHRGRDRRSDGRLQGEL